MSKIKNIKMNYKVSIFGKLTDHWGNTPPSLQYLISLLHVTTRDQHSEIFCAPVLF